MLVEENFSWHTSQCSRVKGAVCYLEVNDLSSDQGSNLSGTRGENSRVLLDVRDVICLRPGSFHL